MLWTTKIQWRERVRPMIKGAARLIRLEKIPTVEPHSFRIKLEIALIKWYLWNRFYIFETLVDK